MKKIFFLIATFVLIGCGGGGSSSDSNADTPIYYEKTVNFTIDTANQIESIKETSNTTINLTIPQQKDIFLVVTSHFDNQDISISSPQAMAKLQKYSNYKSLNKQRSYITPQFVLTYRNKTKNNLIKNQKNYTRRLSISQRVTNQDDSQEFYINTFEGGFEHTKQIWATARKVIANVNTKYGVKNLVVWVEDDEYKENASSDGRVTQAMVDKMADLFLKDGEKNDIYDWVSNIYGAEWGSQAQEKNSNLISNTDYIDILIDDMKTNSIAGYFFSKDNYTKNSEPESNEKVMFYINSRIYDIDEKEVFTTLAHEFQHMIHFYQRNVLKDKPHATWLNEMLSETTEDLVATKIDYDGPRNVDPNDGSAGNPNNDGGRYPIFNDNNTISLTSWSNNLADYGKVSAFGTFLVRNYGGAQVLHDIATSSNVNENAVLAATGESDFKTLLAKWATGVILSDKTNLPNSKPRYNFGNFLFSDYDGIRYDLGSINFFNYNPTPEFKNSATLNNNANLYYHLGQVSGDVTINVAIEKGADITIIAK